MILELQIVSNWLHVFPTNILSAAPIPIQSMYIMHNPLNKPIIDTKTLIYAASTHV
jgi:hypothetical protein